MPEAEPWVGHLRDRYDPTSPLGIPAHVSVLFPFMPKLEITQRTFDRVAGVLRSFQPFSFTLRRVARFPATVYLAPEPAQPFVSMTSALVREFPEYPPYGGRFAEVVPHLTVADQSVELAAVAHAELAATMRAQGEIRATCHAVELYESSDDGFWKPYRSFPLGQPC